MKTKPKELTFLKGQVQIHFTGDGGFSIETDGPAFERVKCPHCGLTDCCYNCDGSQGADDEEEDPALRLGYNAALDGVESLLMSLAASGVITKSEDPRVNEAIQTTLDAIGNNFS